MALPNRLIAMIMEAEDGSAALDGAIVAWIADYLEDDGLRERPLLPFSRSISETIRLVPEAYGWRCWTDLESGLGFARLNRVLPADRSRSRPPRVEWQFQKARTAALALCIGALNAICVDDAAPPVFSHGG